MNIMRLLPTARRFYLLHQQEFLVGPNSFSIRRLSSSFNDETPPTFENGYELATGLWHRCRSRLPKFAEYQDKKVFLHSLSFLAKFLLFVELQMPQKTQVDLVDFVNGATTASIATIQAINSGKFSKFLAGDETNSSEVADKLKLYMTPACYNQMALLVKKKYLLHKFYIECEDMQIDQLQVARVVYQRLTQEDYNDMVNFGFLRKAKNKFSSKASVELLQLHVDVSTVEDLKVVILDKKTSLVQHQNVYRVVFESRVTDPDELDWRIGKMHIIEQKAILRP